MGKRIAAVNEAKRASDLVTPSLKKAQDDLLAAMWVRAVHLELYSCGNMMTLPSPNSLVATRSPSR